MLSRVRVLPSLAAALIAVASLVTTTPAGAVAPRTGKSRAATAPRVEALPTAGARAALRQHVDVRATVPAARARAWEAFAAATGGRWQATWDRATGVPSRAWGGSIHVPGSSASPDVAALAARGFLSRHADLFAPGVAPDELELVTNHWDGRIRTVGFVQRHGDLPVVGGQVSVRFLNDRLYVVSSQILPDVEVDARAAARKAPATELVERARAATADDLELAAATAAAAGELVVVPLVADDAVLGYRLAAPVEVDGGTAGRWIVYADPATGAPLVRHDRTFRASGTLVFDVPVRWPDGGRADYPAARARVTLDGAAATTGAAGELTWVREQSVPLVTSVLGDQVEIVNASSSDDPPEATASLSIAPGGTARWTAAAVELDDAQLATYVHTVIVKEFTRGIVSDPEILAWLDEPIRARVNLDDECNAYYTDGTINFFQSSSMCENTGRLADVVYHEFGHALHHRLVLLGVGGAFDGAMSEGASDFLAASITNDPAMGRGFFKDDEPLRHLDPDGHEARWPQDIGEVHQTGLIYGGAFWDLRKAAIAALGEAEGIALANRLFVATMRRATDIPSSLIEALAADDDDGDLGNGTPNECLIREAFGRHGLRTVGATVAAPGAVTGADAGTDAEVTVTLTGLSAACLGDEIAAVDLSWDPRHDSGSPAEGSAAMTLDGVDTYRGAVPLPDPGDVAEYRVAVSFADGTQIVFPDNPGDPSYQLYRGEVVELYCTDFESDPFADGWTSGADLGEDPWEWGAPQGLAGDPSAAHSGASAVGMALAGGAYQPNSTSWLRSPVIDVGQYSDVRLHYRRFLGVEDGFYDKATIYANDQIAWQNYDSGQGLSASTHTRDREWVFRDVPLSTRISDGTVELTFALASDPGLEFGGWTIDDLCVVADPSSVCGDGVVNRYEQCDDGGGNADAADACRTNCRVAVCGDAIVDTDEECDDGNRADGDACSQICTLPEEAGCCSTGSDPRGALAPVAIVALGLVALGRRRRRRS